MIAVIIMVRRKTSSPSTADTGGLRVFNIGGGPPQTPPEGVILGNTPPGVAMCPPGMEYIGGLCVQIPGPHPRPGPGPEPIQDPPPDPWPPPDPQPGGWPP